jgi:sn-glycerol 3-phosphate transport system substrate-binding protein
MKKTIATIVAILLILSLAACSQSAQETAEEPAAQSDAAVETAVETAPSEPVELTFWFSMDGTPGEIVNKQIDLFNSTVGAEKNIHVTGVFQDWPGTDALTAAMSTDDVDNMPDVIHMFSESVDLIRNWERTAWVEDYITSDSATISKDDLIENTVSAYSINGRMIGAPYAISTLIMYYNQDLLSAAAMTPRRKPWTNWPP